MFILKGYAPCPRPLLAPCGYQKLSFASPFWYPGRPFWHLGATLEDHGRSRKGTREVQNQIFIDFGSILGLCFDVVWALRLEICICFRARFQVTYCTDFLGRNLDARGSYNTLRMAKDTFSQTAPQDR